MPVKEFSSKRQEFDKYPCFLKHTLFNSKVLERVRLADFGNSFFLFDDLKQEGNLYYEDKEYYKAINIYEQVFLIE